MKNADRILIVEDEDTYREFLYRTLCDDYFVDLAHDGSEAVALLGCSRYDAVLCDLRVPGIPGKEIIRSVRTQADKHIVVIVITGYEDDWPPAEATDQQVYFYLKKGTFTPQELKKILSNGLLLRHAQLERKRYEEALVRAKTDLERIVEERTRSLEESEELYRNLFDQALFGVYLAQDGVIKVANTKLSRILCAPPEDLVGSPLSRFIVCERRSMEPECDRSPRASSAVFQEVEIRTPEGATRYALHCSGPVVLGGQEALQGVLLDITEWRKAEQQFLQQQKMESIGTLVGTLAHEFNNILTAILPHAELIKRHAKNHPSVTRSADTIQKMGERASDLLRQLLGVFRQPEFTTVRVNPNEQIRESSKLLEVTLGSSVELDVDLDPSVGEIEIDPNQMDQMMLNLAINARDAMPEGGRLRIATRRLSSRPSWVLDLDGEKTLRSFVEITVADTGTGIDREIIGKIFDPFFTTKAPGKGTGLGLSTVYDIVRRHGGRICVESEPGKGTLFRIVFPVAESEKPATVRAEEKTRQAGLTDRHRPRDLAL